jgi:uncharacterized protein YndB with AHSA1/START domain
MAEESELVVTRVFDAPRSLVFKAWTQPEHLARWWGPQGFVNVAWEMDWTSCLERFAEYLAAA